MNWFNALGAMYLGFWFSFFLLPLIPGFIEKLTNKPNRWRGSYTSTGEYEVSNFGVFTEVLPGRVKIIQRGGEFIRCVMSYEDHVFSGEVPGSDLKRTDDDYWEVLETKLLRARDIKARDSNPVPWNPSWIGLLFFLFSIPWFFWKRWVLKVTGYVFTGIPPFQTVRTYKLEYFKKIKEGSTSVGESDDETNEHGEEKIIRIEDYSDHFRVADFEFPVRVPSADTKDMIPVRAFVDVVAQVFNPYGTAYWTNDWSSRLSAAVVDAVTHYTRAEFIDNVISIKDADPAKQREFSRRVVEIGNDEKRGAAAAPNNVVRIGIRLIQALVIDLSAVDPQDRKDLGELARARVRRQAQEEAAIGRAAEINKQAEAVRNNGHIGLAVLAAERDFRVAEAAGNKAIIVIGSGGAVDPIQAAQLQELKKLSESGKSE